MATRAVARCARCGQILALLCANVLRDRGGRKSSEQAKRKP